MSDPSDILPPSEIEAIVRDYQARVGQVPLNATERNVGRLLAHLRALAAPADGEALGRTLHKALEIDTHCTSFDWPDLSDENADRYRVAALHLHALGHGAGALSREGEIAALQEDASRLESENEDFVRWAHEALDRAGVAPSPADDPGVLPRVIQGLAAKDTEIARLTREIAAMSSAAKVRFGEFIAEIARLTAELADRDARIASIHERNEEERAALQAEIEQGNSMIASAIADRDTARADGAREERKATIADILTVARETHPSAQPAVCEAMRILGERINARGAGDKPITAVAADPAPTNANITMVEASRERHAAELKALAHRYPDARVYTTQDPSSPNREEVFFLAPTVMGEKLAVVFRGEEACLIACDTVSCDTATAPEWDGDPFEVVVHGNFGPVPVIPALRTFRKECVDGFSALLSIVKRLGATASGTVTMRPTIAPARSR